MLSIALSLKLGVALGVISNADLARRATMVVLGAFFVFTGTACPRRSRPSRPAVRSGTRSAFQRFAGWTWVLTGLAFAIVWLLLPLHLAKPVSVVLLISGMLAIAAQINWLRTARRRDA